MFKKSFFNRVTSQQLSAFTIVFVVAAVGAYLLVSSHAATPYASVPGSQGALAGGANSQTDSTASSGQRVVFGQSIPMDGDVALALSAPGTPFAANSFWNTPLPASTPLNVNNAAYSNVIAYNLCHAYPVESTPPTSCPTPTYDGSLATTAWSAPLYVVPANQPLVPMSGHCNNGGAANAKFVSSVLAGGVPIPADAHAAAGTDEEIQIYQPSTNKYWDFWEFQQDSSDKWEACFGGLINNVSQSNGIVPSGLGALSTGLPLLGGVVRTEELEAGQIDHVIGLELPDMLIKNVIPANNCPVSATNPAVNTPGATNGISWPATRSDGVSTDQCAVPEGLRFRLNPKLNLAALDQNPATALSPIAMAIAVAAQKYGFVLFEQTGVTTGNVEIDLGDSTTYTTAGLPNPYISGPGVGGVDNGGKGLFDGTLFGPISDQIMQNFPWNQLQALPFSYGQPTTP